MGYIPREPIERAGAHLLSVLRAEQSVCYSRFYDGGDETHDLLCRALGLENDWYSAETLMDEAAAQLADAGVVAIVSLSQVLADGQQDYRITLTDKGRALPSRRRFRFHFVEL